MNNVTMWIAVATAAIFASELMRSGIRRMREECARMRVASKSLTEYADALEAALADPEVSATVKGALLDISKFVMDRRSACLLRDFLAGDLSHREGGDDLVQSMSALMQRSPKSHETVMAAMKLGLVALVVQWPDTYRDIMRLTLTLAEENSSRIVRKVSSFQTYRHEPPHHQNQAYA